LALPVAQFARSTKCEKKSDAKGKAPQVVEDAIKEEGPVVSGARLRTKPETRR
jgi:hypothetical protein